MTNETELTQKQIIEDIDFRIYNHNLKRFMSRKEIAKYIYNYGIFTEEEINKDYPEEKIELFSYHMIELFKEMFQEWNPETYSEHFCEFEKIDEPLIIFGITEDIKQIKRIRELKGKRY